MYRVRLRLNRHDDWAALTERFAGSMLSTWCNFDNDVVEIHSPDRAEADAVRGALGDLVTGDLVPLGEERDGSIQSIGFRCCNDYEGTVVHLIETHSALLMPPVLYRGGWEYFSFVTLDDARLKDLMAGIGAKGTVELLSKTKIGSPLIAQSYFLSTSDLFGKLTAKQSGALLTALEMGYYDVPRRTHLKEVARRIGQPRTTFEEHVRKAEGKLMRSLHPYLAAYRLDVPVADATPKPKPASA